MNKRDDINVSYDLEKRLSLSIDRVTDNIQRQHKLRREIVRLRRQRRQLESVPDEVRQWFAETEGEEEEDT